VGVILDQPHSRVGLAHNDRSGVARIIVSADGSDAISAALASLSRRVAVTGVVPRGERPRVSPAAVVSTAQTVKAVVLDVFGSVVDCRTGVAAAVRRSVGEQGLELDAGAFADAWRSRYVPGTRRISTGERPFVPLDVGPVNAEQSRPWLRCVEKGR
jgi:hypothetical protein